MQPESGSLPVMVIRPRRGWAGVGLREFLSYHEVLYFLIWRDLKVRYKQTAFGVLWALIQPLAMMLILTLFLGRLPGIQSTSVPYPLFVLAGLIPWTFFAQSLTAAGNSLVDGAALLTKVYFPRLILPIAAASSHIVDFAIGLTLLAAFAVALGFYPTAKWVLLPAFGTLALAAALAVGLWVAAMNVRYRDFRYAMPFVIQAWFFATPIAYDSSAVPEGAKALLALNPMTGVVEGFRWAITGATQPPSATVFVSALVTVAVLAGGLAFVRRVERNLADVI